MHIIYLRVVIQVQSYLKIVLKFILCNERIEGQKSQDRFYRKVQFERWYCFI